jgi:glycerophosphoryl diester phosphodiesterase
MIMLASATYAQNEVAIVGHRGASFLAPENTLASYNLAWELDVVAAECDIMLTKDKQVILFHDKKGKRLTGVDFEVKEVNYSEIKQLSINLKETNLQKYSGEKIPLLSEVLSSLPEGRTLVIEIKTGTEILPYLEKVIKENWKSGNIAFIAFDFETILATKEIYPQIPCYYLSAFKADVNKKFEEIKSSKLEGVNLRHNIINKELVQKFKGIDKNVWCWTVNDPEDAKKLITDGVTAITTDRPEWLKKAIQENL